MQIPNWLRLRLLNHALRVIDSRKCDFTVGEEQSPYMRRWWDIRRNNLFNIYIHEFFQSDEDEALHDHMYFNISLVLSGGYHEVLQAPKDIQQWSGPIMIMMVREGDVRFRMPSTPHRIELWRTNHRRVITIFITGPRVRSWGFLCPHKWTHFQEFLNRKAATGKGCGVA